MPFRYAVLACWLVLIANYLFRKRPPQAREIRRGKEWARGLLWQIVAVALAMWPQPRKTVGLEIGSAAVLLAAASVAIMIASERALGRQFAYQARLVEGHRLIRTGPYRWVRHPIYLGLYGLALATTLVRGYWILIPVFTTLYAFGTALRVRSEERLLREEFGPEFEEYARRVPAVIPGAGSHRPVAVRRETREP